MTGACGVIADTSRRLVANPEDFNKADEPFDNNFSKPVKFTDVDAIGELKNYVISVNSLRFSPMSIRSYTRNLDAV